MFARVTLLEIDTVRLSMDAALARFRSETLPRLRLQPGYRGIYVLTTPDGKAALMSLWDTEPQAASDAGPGFYGEELGHFATFFRSAPGRDTYDVSLVDEPVPSR
jgi:hypothetical protein